MFKCNSSLGDVNVITAAVDVMLADTGPYCKFSIAWIFSICINNIPKYKCIRFTEWRISVR